MYTGSEENLRDLRWYRDDAKRRARASRDGKRDDLFYWARKAAGWTLAIVGAKDIAEQEKELAQ